MPKRGQRQPYRTLYVFDEGQPAPWSVERRGSIPANDLFGALINARAPLSAVAGGRAETCAITIVRIGDDGARTEIATYADADSLEAAISVESRAPIA